MSDELKKLFGQDYPKTVVVLGQRLSLQRESRFVRYYKSENESHGSILSKFQDGTASITFDELQREWPQWSPRERMDFLHACNGLLMQPDYADMLRYLMKQDDPNVWSAIALDVAGRLPRDEAFDVLVSALDRIDSHTANITQGISATRHANAGEVLQRHFQDLWSRPNLWDDDQFTNWTAFDAICCLSHLLDLGVDPKEFEAQARQLHAHVCAGSRNACSTFLSRHYAWIQKPDLGSLGLDPDGRIA